MTLRVVTPEQFQEGFTIYLGGTTIMRHIPYRKIGETPEGNIVVEEPEFMEEKP
jgi:hypothetical protein